MKRRRLQWLSLLSAATLLFSSGPMAAEGIPEEVQEEDSVTWKLLQLEDLVAGRQTSGRSYLPFLQVPALRAGLYVLAAGAEDRQRPHEEDEVYYVIRGKGVFGPAARTVRSGPAR